VKREDLQGQIDDLQVQITDLAPDAELVTAPTRMGRALQRARFALKRTYKVAVVILVVIATTPCVKLGNTNGIESFVSPVDIAIGQPTAMHTGHLWWKDHFIRVDGLFGTKYVPITVD